MPEEEKRPTKKHKINWIPFLIVLVMIVFALILMDPWHLMGSNKTDLPIFRPQSPNGAAAVLPTLTPLPTDYPKLDREYFENANETDGIIVGGSLLVLIIVIGTLVYIRNERKKQHEK